jgi:insertion element IS1 protein InsB
MNTTTFQPTSVPPCSRCAAAHVVRNGLNSAGTPTFRCRVCGHRFVANPRHRPVPEEKRVLIRRLLLERLSLRAIVRAVGVSRSWLQRFVNTLYAQTPWEPGPVKKKAGQVRLEVDEMWSFIGKKQEPCWVWTALDSRTRQVVGMAAGDREEFTARCLWESLSPEYRERAIVATDLLPVYQAIVPEKWHATGGKEMGLTAHIERFFGTLRQR